MKRKSIKRERRILKKQAEEQARTECGKKIAWMQNIVMPVSMIAGLLAAGCVRQLHGDSIGYSYVGYKRTVGGQSDPLILLGLFGGTLLGGILCRWIRRRMQ